MSFSIVSFTVLYAINHSFVYTLSMSATTILRYPQPLKNFGFPSTFLVVTWFSIVFKEWKSEILQLIIHIVKSLNTPPRYKNLLTLKAMICFVLSLTKCVGWLEAAGLYRRGKGVVLQVWGLSPSSGILLNERTHSSPPRQLNWRNIENDQFTYVSALHMR